MLVKQQYNKQKISFEPKDIEGYFNLHMDDFKLPYDSYLINRIDFTNEDKAVQFRSTVLESDWDKALNVFVGDTSIVKSNTKILLYDYQIYPRELYKVIKELNQTEVSIVINYQKNDFILVQMLNKFGKGTVPPLEVIRDRVTKRFIADRKNKLLEDYINELYSNNDIEVKN